MPQETLSPRHENKNETHENVQDSHEYHEKLREQLEVAAERSPEKGAENARVEAVEHARSAEKASQENFEASPSEYKRGPITRKQKDASFNSTMHEVRSQMSAPSKAFSQVIHNKAVEQASEVVGSSIARPNALLSGAVCAFAITLAVYLVAKNIGYPLSGFESIGAFILGWVIGTAYDFIKVMVTGKR